MTNTRSTWPVVSLLDPNNITVSFNTDGVAVFQSSKNGELWPLCIVINELSLRIRQTNKMILFQDKMTVMTGSILSMLDFYHWI